MDFMKKIPRTFLGLSLICFTLLLVMAESAHAVEYEYTEILPPGWIAASNFWYGSDISGENKHIIADQWNILALSNGMRNVSEVARVLNLDEFKVIKAIYLLVQAGLMERVAEQKPIQKKFVRENIFSVIENELRKVMGAVSPFVVDDKLVEFGEKKDSFPQDKLLSFVEALGEEIPQDDKRKEFKRAVMEFFSIEK